MTKVLYITGWGRSGTTILDNLLGQVEGFVSTGELHYVWTRGVRDNRLCGCGQPLRECETWQRVFEQGFGGLDNVDVAEVIANQNAVHTRDARRILAAVRSNQVGVEYPYADDLSRVYRGIEAASGARVIVDSSKFPADGIIAAGIEGLDVHILHMVRDPRAVAFSWSRIKESPGKVADKGKLTRVDPGRSTLTWVFYNAVIRRYVRKAVPSGNYRMLQYERLAAEPEAVIDELIAFLGEQPQHRPAFDGNTVELQPSHTASGNPVRFSTGATTIRLDDEWKRAMPWWRRLFVTLLAVPLLRATNYTWTSDTR